MTTPRTEPEMAAAIAALTPAEVKSAIYRAARYDSRLITDVLNGLDHEREYAATLNTTANGRPLEGIDYRMESIPGTSVSFAQCLGCDHQTAEYHTDDYVYSDIEAHILTHWTAGNVTHERYTL